MGTPANHQLLASAGLSHHDLAEASPVDLMLAVEAETDAAAEAVLASAKEFFDRRRRERESTGRVLPRTSSRRSGCGPMRTWRSCRCPEPTPRSRR